MNTHNAYPTDANAYNANPGFTYPNPNPIPVTTVPVVEQHGLGAATQLGVNHNFSHDNTHPTGLGAATGLGVDHHHTAVAPIGTVHQVPTDQHAHKHHLLHRDHHTTGVTAPTVAGAPIHGTHHVGAGPTVAGAPIHGTHHVGAPNVTGAPLGTYEHGTVGAPGAAIVPPVGTALQHKVEVVKQAVTQDHREIDMKAQEKINALQHDTEVRHAKLQEKDADINKHERVDQRLQAKVNDVEERALKEHHKVDERTTKKINRLAKQVNR